MVIHSYLGQRKKLLDRALQTGKAQLMSIPQVTVRSWEVILSAVKASGGLSGRTVMWDFI